MQKSSNYTLCMKEIKCLGYLVGESSLRTDPDKVSAIANSPVTVTTRQVRRFLGMTGYYRKFVVNYASVATPITDCMKGNRFKWAREAQGAFQSLKRLLSSAPVLVNADFNKWFYIQCDASNLGVGYVLFQKDCEGGEHPIAFVQRN